MVCPHGAVVASERLGKAIICDQCFEREQAACCQNIGIVLLDLGKQEDAILCWVQALAVYKTIRGTERQQAACCVNIGNALSDVGK